MGGTSARPAPSRDQKTQHRHVVGLCRDPGRQAFARHQPVEIGAQRAALGRQDQRLRGDQRGKILSTRHRRDGGRRG
jgi:hypothetical protein